MKIVVSHRTFCWPLIALILLAVSGCVSRPSAGGLKDPRDTTIANLVADKQDLLQQTARMRAEIADLQEKTTRLDAYVELLEKYKLPTTEQLGRNGYEIVAKNNPLLASQADIRKIKKEAPNVRTLWQLLKPLAESYHELDDERDLAVGAMLVVGAFYDFGNPPPNERDPGCVSNSATRGYVPVETLTFDMHMKSDIGCCTDFTMMLGSFLQYLGFECTALLNGAHQCLRVKLGNRWHLLDATTLVFVQDYFEAGPKTVFYFPTYSRNRTFPFQSVFVKSLVFENQPYGPTNWTKVSITENNKIYRAEYLNAEQIVR